MRVAQSIEFSDFCRRHKLKCTAQRSAVFAFLSGNRNHPTADEVWRAVRGSIPGMSLDSVYRILDDFARVGLVQKLECGAGAVRYDPESESHDHFFCRLCGRLIDLDCTVHRPELSEFSGCGEAEHLEFRVKGICRMCLGASRTR